MTNATPKRVFVLFDRSMSMSCGMPDTKLKEGASAAIRHLSLMPEEGREIVILTFDHMVDVITLPRSCGLQDVSKVLSKIIERGLTNIASAIGKLDELASGFGEAEAIIVTDGRVNFGLGGGGAEGDRALMEEVLKTSEGLRVRGIPIHVISVGEDAFDGFLRAIAAKTGGIFSYANGLRLEKPVLRLSCSLYGIPEELPAGQPTWAKELNTMHVVVASQECAQVYAERRAAFLHSEGTGSRIRVPLISVEEGFLEPFRRRLPKRTEQVREQRAVLVDAANRRALGTNIGDTVELEIY